MDAIEIVKIESELRECLDARRGRLVAGVYVPARTEPTPTEELLRLLNTLLGFSASCTNHSKTRAYAWNNAVRVQRALALQERSMTDLSVLEIGSGVHVHKVDFIDHAFYDTSSPTETTPFEFLFVLGAGPVGTTNRLRLSQMVAAFEHHGLRLVRLTEQYRRPFPPSERERLAPQFRSLPAEDLDTISAVLAFQRPWGDEPAAARQGEGSA